MAFALFMMNAIYLRIYGHTSASLDHTHNNGPPTCTPTPLKSCSIAFVRLISV